MRHKNDGLSKICECDRRAWAKCSHSWHFSFKWKGKRYRFSLDRQIGKPIDSKTDAETHADQIRDEIRQGTFRLAGATAPPEPRPQRETLTVEQLLTCYLRNYVRAVRPSTADHAASEINVLTRVELTRTDGQPQRFGAWLAVDVTRPTLEAYRLARTKKPIACSRNLALLRAAYAWAISEDVELLDRTPFRRRPGAKGFRVKLDERPRERRLEADEGERLLAAAGPHLRALIEAALETGCRLGELLSLQWHQVQQDGPRRFVRLPAGKTKSRKERTVPISTRLQAILEMRRKGPDDKEHGPDAYVFGNDAGERVGEVKKAWRLTCGRAKITNLHFHDLRREAGSRWLEGGVPLTVIQNWLGHWNITQTSTYLASTNARQFEAMQAYELRLAQRGTFSETGGRKRPRSAAMRDKKPNKTGADLH